MRVQNEKNRHNVNKKILKSHVIFYFIFYFIRHEKLVRGFLTLEIN